jgi:glycosyltransferase involved in cell wall biosynthesis
VVAGNLTRKISERWERKTKAENQIRIVSIARIAPEKNTLYALEALAKLKIPITADFFGSVYDAVYFEACKKVVETFPSSVHVNFPGALPSEKINETLSNYDLLFMPTRGENFGHIILEALQAGTPVLISDQTPWKNLANENAGWDLPLRPQKLFAETIETVAKMNEQEFSKWAEGAKKLGAKYAADPELINKNRELFLIR